MSKDPLQKRTTSSEDEPSSEAISGPQCTTSTSRKMAASIALQIVDSDQEKDQDNTTSLTLAQEIASFEFIDEKTSSTSSPISSLASDFDVWSPRDKDTTSAQLEEEDAILAYAADANANAGNGSSVGGGLVSVEAVGGGNKKRFLDLIEAKNLLSIPARRASAESLSSPQQPQKEATAHSATSTAGYGAANSEDSRKSRRGVLPTSMSVTLDLNRKVMPADGDESPPDGNEAAAASGGSYYNRSRNNVTRKSILVRQSKVDDHRSHENLDEEDDEENKEE